MLLVEKELSNLQSIESDRTKLPEAVLCRVIYPVCWVDELNANGRIYEKAVWEKVLKDQTIQDKMSTRTLFGQAEHPQGTQSDLQLTSHTIFNSYLGEAVNQDGEKKPALIQKIDVLDTPTGRIVDCLLRAGCKVGVSTRAEGDLQEVEMEEGKKVQRVVPEAYKYITTDFTADPSTFGSMPIEVKRNVVTELKKVVECKESQAHEKVFATKLMESIEHVTEATTTVEVKPDAASATLGGDICTVNINPNKPGGVSIAVTSPEPTPPVPVVGEEVPKALEDPTKPELKPGETVPDKSDTIEEESDEVEEAIDPLECAICLEKVGKKEDLDENNFCKGCQDQAAQAIEENWKGLPKGWTKASLNKFAKSLTKKTKGKPKGFVKACITRMKGKMDNPGAFCAGLADEFLGTTYWRGKAKKESTEVEEGIYPRYKTASEREKKLFRELRRDHPNWDIDSVWQLVGQTVAAEKAIDAKLAAGQDAHIKISAKESISSVAKESIDLKVQEASVRAERDTLSERLGSLELQCKMLQKKIKDIRESASNEISGLRSLLEKKAQKAKDSQQKLEETKQSEAAIYNAHQEELVKTANESLAEGRQEVVKEYFDRRLGASNLQIDDNSRALLEKCQSLPDVDELLEQIVAIARRSALHPSPITEIRIHPDVPIDPRQQAIDEQVGGLLKSWN